MTVISGPPKSDKEGVLVSTLDGARDSGYRRDSNILIFRHPKDSADPERVGTHAADLITDAVEEIYKLITPKTRNVIIAGAAHYDADISLLVDALVRSNRNIILSGPNLDARGQPYGCMPDLMALADEVKLTKAFCYITHCNEIEANRCVQLDTEFEAVCADHYYFPGSPPISLNYAGRLVMDLGPMYSDKTRRWSNHIKAIDKKKKKRILFKPWKSSRYGELEAKVFDESVVTLNTKEVIPGAIVVKTAEDMREYLQKHLYIRDIFRDETQFIPGIYDLTLELLGQGYNLYDTGLPRGFNRKKFGEVPKLMCLADVIEMGYATCVQCGHPATENQRMKREENGRVIPAHIDEEMEAPGGLDSGRAHYFYEARCLAQWMLRGEPENKFRLERHSG